MRGSEGGRQKRSLDEREWGERRDSARLQLLS